MLRCLRAHAPRFTRASARTGLPLYALATVPPPLLLRGCCTSAVLLLLPAAPACLCLYRAFLYGSTTPLYFSSLLLTATLVTSCAPTGIYALSRFQTDACLAAFPVAVWALAALLRAGLVVLGRVFCGARAWGMRAGVRADGGTAWLLARLQLCRYPLPSALLRIVPALLCIPRRACCTAERSIPFRTLHSAPCAACAAQHNALLACAAWPFGTILFILHYRVRLVRRAAAPFSVAEHRGRLYDMFAF